jgi:GTP-binding protein
MAGLPARFVKGVVSLDGLPRARIPEIAASGRSNVGKSSLLNVLFGRKGLARVSQTPGKTQEINFFAVGGSWHLVDLPGYGYARAPESAKAKWSALVRDYLETREQLAGIVQLVDSRHGATALDREMLEWLASTGRPTLVVATKMDKIKRNAQNVARKALETEWGSRGLEVVGFSAVTRDGKREILAWIDRTLEAWRHAGGFRSAAGEGEAR